MKISFLVTYFNQEAYVKQSLDSILKAEKPEDWEILVGDDGSSDHTAEKVKEYIQKDPEHIRLFVMPREEGVRYDFVRRASANRLNLLRHCTGDCFCVLDGDDFYTDSQFVKDAIQIFEKHEEVSLVSFGFGYYRDGKFGEEFLLPGAMEGMVHSDEYVRKYYIHAGACVFRILWDRDRLEKIQEIGYFDDNDIVMNSLAYGRMFYVNRCIYAYRQTGDSIYTRMKLYEKAVLNVQGYDVDQKLAGPELADALLVRVASPILQMYLNRKRSRDLLGAEKYDRYVNGSRRIGDSLCYKLLSYGNLSGEERREVHAVIRKILFLCPVLTGKNWMSHMLKGRQVSLESSVTG